MCPLQRQRCNTPTIALKTNRTNLAMYLTPVDTACRGIGHERGLAADTDWFETQFSSEQACRDYLSGLSWHDGFTWPAGLNRTVWETAQHPQICGECGCQTLTT